MRTQKGITLISLSITIIILLILGAIVMSFTLTQNGIINQAKQAKLSYEQEAAKEKLEVALLNLQSEKITNQGYNQDEYVTSKLQEEKMVVNGDIVIVDTWQFQIDRTVPKIIASLGNKKESSEMTITTKIEVKNDELVSIQITIFSTQKIKQISINDTKITVPEEVQQKYEIEKEVTKNGTYMIYAMNEKEEYKTLSVKITQVAEDLKIKTAEELCMFRDNVNLGVTYHGKTIQLMNDIDLSQVSYSIDGTIEKDKSWEPISKYEDGKTRYFEGTFNGNGHKIFHLYSNTNENYQGLFGNIEKSAYIYNLTLQGQITGKDSVGGIAGNFEQGKISNCHNEILIHSSGIGSGGIIGSALKATTNVEIVNSSNRADINGYKLVGSMIGRKARGSIKIESCYNQGNIKADYMQVGGIVGGTFAGTTSIINCYNTGNLTVKQRCGGMIGEANSLNATEKLSISNSYNVGKITASTAYGGIMGSSSASITLTNCYFLDTSCNSGVKTGVKKVDGDTLKQMQSTLGSAYTEDSNAINYGYPILNWQSKR